jgi:hypothetical protein
MLLAKWTNYAKMYIIVSLLAYFLQKQGNIFINRIFLLSKLKYLFAN